MVDFYKNNGFNATVTVEEKRTCIIDGHGTNNIKMLIADYKFQVEEEVEGSGANWFLGKLKHRKMKSVSTAVQPVFNPFSQFVPQLELYSQLQLSLWSDPIAFSVPKPT